MKSSEKLTPMQQKAIEHSGKNALVSASAGSGKTFVVIERIIKLITEKNVSVKNILAVTFTKLAAQEMKEKLLNALTKKYVTTKDKKLKEEIESVNSADIVTIDSFCQKLIKKHFYVLGIDPNFEVLDDSRAKVLEETAIDNLFERLYQEKNQNFLKIVPIFSNNRGDEGLKKEVKKLYSDCESEGGIDIVLNKTIVTFNNIFDIIDKEFSKKIKDFAFEYLVKFKDVSNLFEVDVKRKEYALNLYEICYQLHNSVNFYDFFKDFSKYNLSLPSGGKKEEKDSAEKLKAIANEFKEKIQVFKDFYAVDKSAEEANVNNSLEIIKALFEVVSLYKEEYEKLKREENVLSFSDISILALKLFENEEILQSVKNSYEHIFVDEYQDVNAIQESLINALERNNLFLVGDSKQSIYAFRGCNPTYFTNKFDKYLSGDGEAISLDNNFRSAKNVIELVNSIFKKVMTKEFGGYNYFDNPMIYGKKYENFDGIAKIHVINKPEKVKEEKDSISGVYSVKNSENLVKESEISSEAKLVVKLVNDALNSTWYDIKEKSENKVKKVEYKDISILLRSVSLTSKLVREITDSLIALGLPISSTGEKEIKNYPEIKVLTSLVSLLVCADRDIPLATVMLSLFNFSEEELKVVRESSVKTSFYQAVLSYSKTQDDLGKKCLRFLDWLAEKRLIAEFLSADDVILNIVKETGFLSKLLASRYGDVRVKRVERFIEECTQNGKKLRISELEANLDSILEDLSMVESGGEDTIKLMTMHASKGLEFPVVIVAGTDKKFNNKDYTASVVRDRDLGVAIKTYNDSDMTYSSNSVLNFLKYKIQKTAADEELRLFYVALTRAKYQLHVVVKHEDLDSEVDYSCATKMSDFLHLIQSEKVYYNEDELEGIEEKQGTSVAGGKGDEGLIKKIVENLSYVYPYQAEKSLPVKSSVSDANKHEDGEYYKTTSEFGFSSSEKGTIYHKIFELVDFYNYNKNDIDEFIASGIITTEQAKLIDRDKIQRILNLDIFREIKNSKLYKERKFCQLVPANELNGAPSSELVLIQGIIDLIAVDSDGAILIDYKISTIESDDDLRKSYQTQMHLYKAAIEKILKIKVKKVLLINVLQEKVVEV